MTSEDEHTNVPDESGAPVDDIRLDGITGGDADMRRCLADLFVTDTRERLEILRNALAHGASEDMELAAHSIKGASGNLGANRMQELADQLEALCRSGDLSTAEQILASLQHEFTRVETYLSD